MEHRIVCHVTPCTKGSSSLGILHRLEQNANGNTQYGVSP